MRWRTSVLKISKKIYLDSWIGANCSGHCEYYNKILLDDVPYSLKNKVWEAVYQGELEAKDE